MGKVTAEVVALLRFLEKRHVGFLTNRDMPAAHQAERAGLIEIVTICEARITPAGRAALKES